MTESNTSHLPPQMKFGYVFDRVIRAVGDKSYDKDRFPDGIPAKGTVTFVPKQSVKHIATDARGYTVTREPIVCQIYTGQEEYGEVQTERLGQLVDEAGFIGGVWLPLGAWTATYQFEDRYSSAPDQEFYLTEEYTLDEPYDIPALAGILPEPAIKFVVNEKVYSETLAARDKTLVYRNEAVAARDLVLPARDETLAAHEEVLAIGDSLDPKLTLITTGEYEFVAPYLTNISTGIYEIGA